MEAIGFKVVVIVSESLSAEKRERFDEKKGKTAPGKEHRC